MVLDADCTERLAACLAEPVGVVAGRLRDPLFGCVEAVKLFRTACVQQHPFGDVISPDTDFVATIARRGWRTVYALRAGEDRTPAAHTFGEHRPPYTPSHAYARNAVEGRRWRHRGDVVALEHHLRVLHESAHPAARIGEVALAHGVFLDGERDLHSGYRDDEECGRLVAFLAGGRKGKRVRAAPPPWSTLLPWPAFRRYYACGIALARSEAADEFEQLLAGLNRSAHPWSLLMRLGLCHGLFAERYSAAACAGAWAKLGAFRGYFTPSETVRRVLRARRQS
jgi:hypothetical protein